MGDQFRFPARAIPAGDESSPLPGRPGDRPRPSFADAEDGSTRFLRRPARAPSSSSTTTGSSTSGTSTAPTGDDRQTSFSVAKSFLSTLVGIAIDEGPIGGVTDPVTDYVPELADRDPRFAQITLARPAHDVLRPSLRGAVGPPALGRRHRHLLRHGPSRPGAGPDRRSTAAGRGLALQQLQPAAARDGARAGDRDVGLRVHVDEALAAARGRRRRHLEPGLRGCRASRRWRAASTRAPVDYARFGQLFLHGGEWNGTRIVSRGLGRAATAADGSPIRPSDYEYFWWVDVERPGRFYALGNLGQYVYVAPDAGRRRSSGSVATGGSTTTPGSA